jgi:hypothetical protein
MMAGLAPRWRTLLTDGTLCRITPDDRRGTAVLIVSCWINPAFVALPELSEPNR